MRFSKILPLSAVCLAFSLSVVAAEDGFPEVTVDGLHLVKGTQLAHVYAKPNVDLSQYGRISLTRPQIAFTKNWLRRQNSIPNTTITSEDMVNIKKNLSDLFMEVFKQELQNNGGYVLVDGAAEDVLTVHPAIVNLDVVAPDTPRTRGTRSAIETVGQMTLYLELMDSVTGDMLVKALDHQVDRSRVRIQLPNSMRNEAAAREMLTEWAVILRKGLDEARMAVRGQ